MKQADTDTSLWNLDVKNELPASLKPIQRKGLAEIVVEHLRQAILSGQLAPGQTLPEEQVGQKLGVSRIPVREAFSQLEREGLILIRPNRSACVARLSQVDAEEVFSLRLALERLAIQRFVQQATENDFLEMEAIIREMERARSGNLSLSEAVELDIRFHDHIYELSNHQRLNTFWSNLRPQVHILLLQIHVAHPGFIIGNPQTHTNLLAVLRSRDEEVAIRTLEAHVQAGHEHIMNSYLDNDASRAEELL